MPCEEREGGLGVEWEEEKVGYAVVVVFVVFGNSGEAKGAAMAGARCRRREETNQAEFPVGGQDA